MRAWVDFAERPAQPLVERAQARPLGGRALHRLVGGAQTRKVSLERIGWRDRRSLGVDEEGGQPFVECRVVRAIGEEVDGPGVGG